MPSRTSSASDCLKNLYRPDVTAQVLFTQDERQAVALADAAAGRPRSDLASAPAAPVVTILDPSEGASVTTSPLTVRVAVRSPSGEPVQSVRALVQGRLMQLRDVRDQTPSRPTPEEEGVAPESSLYSLPVTLPAEDCTLAIQAETAQSRSQALLHLRWAGPKAVTVAPFRSLRARGGHQQVPPEPSAPRVSRPRMPRIWRRHFKTQEGKALSPGRDPRPGRRAGDSRQHPGGDWPGCAKRQHRRIPLRSFLPAMASTRPATASTISPYDAEPGAAADTMVDAGQIQSFLGSIRGKGPPISRHLPLRKRLRDRSAGKADSM